MNIWGKCVSHQTTAEAGEELSTETKLQFCCQIFYLAYWIFAATCSLKLILLSSLTVKQNDLGRMDRVFIIVTFYELYKESTSSYMYICIYSCGLECTHICLYMCMCLGLHRGKRCFLLPHMALLLCLWGKISPSIQSLHSFS